MAEESDIDSTTHPAVAMAEFDRCLHVFLMLFHGTHLAAIYCRVVY